MAVPLEKRCVFSRCHLAGLYTITVSRIRDDAPMSKRKVCLDHRDLFESVWTDITAGRTVHLVPKKASKGSRSEPAAGAAAAVAGS